MNQENPYAAAQSLQASHPSAPSGHVNLFLWFERGARLLCINLAMALIASMSMFTPLLLVLATVASIAMIMMSRLPGGTRGCRWIKFAAGWMGLASIVLTMIWIAPSIPGLEDRLGEDPQEDLLLPLVLLSSFCLLLGLLRFGSGLRRQFLRNSSLVAIISLIVCLLLEWYLLTRNPFYIGEAIQATIVLILFGGVAYAALLISLAAATDVSRFNLAKLESTHFMPDQIELPHALQNDTSDQPGKLG